MPRVAAVHRGHVIGGQRIGEHLHLRACLDALDQSGGSLLTRHEVRRDHLQRLLCVPDQRHDGGPDHRARRIAVVHGHLGGIVGDESIVRGPLQFPITRNQPADGVVLAQCLRIAAAHGQRGIFVEPLAQVVAVLPGSRIRRRAKRWATPNAEFQNRSNDAETSRTTGPTMAKSRSTKFTSSLAAEIFITEIAAAHQRDPVVRDPALVVHAPVDARRNSRMPSPTICRLPLREAKGLNRRTSILGCASSAAKPAFLARASMSSTSRRTRTPRSAACSSSLRQHTGPWRRHARCRSAHRGCARPGARSAGAWRKPPFPRPPGESRTRPDDSLPPRSGHDRARVGLGCRAPFAGADRRCSGNCAQPGGEQSCDADEGAARAARKTHLGGGSRAASSAARR